jgi:hypothetical protein
MNGNAFQVVYGKHSFADLDPKTGKLLRTGSD